MNIRKTFHTIDTHTCGEPTRNVIGGIPHIPGETMQEKLHYMSTKGDWLRKLLTYEPRGNEVMSGTLIMEPCNPEADFGVLYFEVGGWMPMCGHDTIGVGGSWYGRGAGAVHLCDIGHRRRAGEASDRSQKLFGCQRDVCQCSGICNGTGCGDQDRKIRNLKS